MTEIFSSLEGELLIRSILCRSKDSISAQDTDTLRLNANCVPSPAVPQIAAKAGFRRLEIVSGCEFSGASSPISVSFAWQGIDGTKIDTCMQGGKGMLDATRGGIPALLRGELPVFDSTPIRSGEGDDHPPSHLTQDAEFLDAIRPPGIFEYALADLGGDIDTRGLKRPVLVLNNASFFANEAVAIQIASGEKPVTAIGPEGDAEQIQILQNPDEDGINFALFVAKNAPLHGYAVWDLGATLTPTESNDELSVSPTHIENSSIRIEFDHATGLILKIFDKDSERDILNQTFEVRRNGKRDLLLQSCGNLIEVTPPGQAPIPVMQLDAVEVIEAGPVRAALRFTRTLPGGQSTIRQIVRLTAHSARIDFVTEVDWNEDDATLTVAFPLAINSSRASYEIPFGYIERPTYWQDARTKPQVMDGHDWVDISEGDYGITLLNDGRLECDAYGIRLRIAVRMQDNGINLKQVPHRFTYSLLPHAGDLREGEVVENSNAIIAPPAVMAVAGNRPGKLPLERSFFEVDSASVFISCIKRAKKEENAIIVRLHEAHNTRGVVLLTTTLPVKSAWLCDLLEHNLAEIPLDNGEALLPFHPFEIVTVKYTL